MNSVIPKLYAMSTQIHMFFIKHLLYLHSKIQDQTSWL